MTRQYNVSNLEINDDIKDLCVLHQGAINKIIPLLIMGTFSCLGGIVSTTISQCRCYNDSCKNTFLPPNSSRPPCFCQRPYSSTCPTPWRREKHLGPNSTFSAAPPIQGRTRILFQKRQKKNSGAARSLAQNLNLALRRSLCDTQTPIQSMIFKITTIMNFKWKWTRPLSVNISFIQHISIAANPAKIKNTIGDGGSTAL